MDKVNDSPELIGMWSPTNPWDPKRVSLGSRHRASWICPTHGEFFREVRRMVGNSVCPKCSGSRVDPGTTDLMTRRPDLEELWDFDSNTVDPYKDVGVGSKIKVNWRCSSHGVYRASIKEVVRGSRCPSCSGHAVVPGTTDLFTTNPELRGIWCDRNTENPERDLSRGSNKEVLWECKNHGEWTARIKHVARGSRCPKCHSDPSVNSKSVSDSQDLLALWSKNNPSSPSDVFANSNGSFLWSCEYHGEWESPAYQVNRAKQCPRCSPHISSYERAILRRLPEDEEVVSNSRRIIPPYEVDIYIPRIRLAIEVHGVYWHSEKFQAHQRDMIKYDMLRAAGVDVLVVWEDDWVRNPDAIMATIMHKLGTSSRTVYARKTAVAEISYQESAQFMDSFHVQGRSRGSVHLALMYDGEIVAAMSLLRRVTGDLELVRYSTKCSVPGGHSKLVSYVENNYEYRNLVTFADKQSSSGKLYRTTGWTQEADIPPDYRYLVRGERVHKFNYRKKRFRDDPSLTYVEGAPESRLAELNNLHRVYDYGKLRFIKPHPGLTEA